MSSGIPHGRLEIAFSDPETKSEVQPRVVDISLPNFVIILLGAIEDDVINVDNTVFGTGKVSTFVRSSIKVKLGLPGLIRRIEPRFIQPGIFGSSASEFRAFRSHTFIAAISQLRTCEIHVVSVRKCGLTRRIGRDPSGLSVIWLSVIWLSILTSGVLELIVKKFDIIMCVFVALAILMLSIVRFIAVIFSSFYPDMMSLKVIKSGVMFVDFAIRERVL
ncbi:Hypothetical protein D9617_53g017760 [Elsinoe fawcettii]|nr:Hypothetical protein D9617_53g017760 [Elsinoe fawcettii]